jgi:hypothetical protein
MRRLLFAVLACLALLGTGATTTTVLTSASATSCTSITASAGSLYSINTASNLDTTVVLTIYNEGSSPTCAAADKLYTNTFGPSQVQAWPAGLPFSSGLAYTLSTTLTDNMAIAY